MHLKKNLIFVLESKTPFIVLQSHKFLHDCLDFFLVTGLNSSRAFEIYVLTYSFKKWSEEVNNLHQPNFVILNNFLGLHLFQIFFGKVVRRPEHTSKYF